MVLVNTPLSRSLLDKEGLWYDEVLTASSLLRVSDTSVQRQPAAVAAVLRGLIAVGEEPGHGYNAMKLDELDRRAKEQEQT